MTLPSLPAKGSTDWFPWASGIDSAVRSGSGSAAATVVDNGDGTFTASGTAVVDNGDGTFTITA